MPRQFSVSSSEKTRKQDNMPRRHPSSQPAHLDRPRLVPHAGLPGLDGTTRFAYSMEAAGVARDAFKLLPLLPTPLSASSSSSSSASPSAVAAAADSGVGALGGGVAVAGGASAVAGGTSGLQVWSFFFLLFVVTLPLSLFFNLDLSRKMNSSLSQGTSKGWSPTTGAYTAPGTEGGGTQ